MHKGSKSPDSNRYGVKGGFCWLLKDSERSRMADSECIILYDSDDLYPGRSSGVGKAEVSRVRDFVDKWYNTRNVLLCSGLYSQNLSFCACGVLLFMIRPKDAADEEVLLSRPQFVGTPGTEK